MPEVKTPTPYEKAKADASALLTGLLFADQGRAPSVKQQESVNELVDTLTACAVIQSTNFSDFG